MIHRKLRYAAGWEWHIIQEQRDSAAPGSTDEAPPPPLGSRKSRTPAPPPGPSDQVEAAAEEGRAEQTSRLCGELPFCSSWIREASERRHNLVSYTEEGGGVSILSGTLMIQLSEQGRDTRPLHFWLQESRLVTWHEDLRLPLRLQTSAWSESMERCATAPEGFAVLLSAALEVFHSGLDEFERRLTGLENAVHNRNRTALLPVIFERRHDLLHWNHLFLPVREVHDAAKEAFMDGIVQSASFQRLSYKLERIDSLLTHYTSEMDTLIAMDDAIANFRGNDIMKTLTIFTALFVPSTIAGTLWGVNFHHLPGRNSEWGFIIMCVAVVAVTCALYAWLWHKGWTGDLLTDRPSTPSGDSSASASPNSRSAARAPERRQRRKFRKSPSAGGRSRRPYPGSPSEEE
ncbi:MULTISPECIES: magnesium transporter CorA family protein [unclassified Paenibacillus]|uniref:magnesium transporter CorA family protein n=1 Tax=Paenibacillus TaxID=44249 RepID=UPI000422F293|nr:MULTISPECIES: magnesium transporter CorA family protein [unclassified Paenibacillus]KKC47582.1 hypothetical protein VE23_11240 [Paenibacillus sp. D9]CDN44589.1 Mg2 transporter protein CorA family protein [Paenibacillus sp. P22]